MPINLKSQTSPCKRISGILTSNFPVKHMAGRSPIIRWMARTAKIIERRVQLLVAGVGLAAMLFGLTLGGCELRFRSIAIQTKATLTSNVKGKKILRFQAGPHWIEKGVRHGDKEFGNVGLGRRFTILYDPANPTDLRTPRGSRTILWASPFFTALGAAFVGVGALCYFASRAAERRLEKKVGESDDLATDAWRVVE